MVTTGHIGSPDALLLDEEKIEAVISLQLTFGRKYMDQNRVSALREKHGQLDEQIVSEQNRPFPDTILIHDLKKEKLRLKEELREEA